MINIKTIYTDLKAVVSNDFKTDTITISNFLLFSLKNESVKTFLKKYNTDIDIFAKELNKLLVKKVESDQKKTIGFIQETRVSALDNLSFLKTKKEEIQADQLFSKLINLAHDKSIEQINEISKKTNKPILYDQTIVSYESLIFVILDQINSSTIFLQDTIKESKFNVDKFKEDFMNHNETQTSVINEFCTNLVEQAKQGKFQEVIGRESEIIQIANILAKARKNNPILNGKAGVGKTAIVEGLAKLIAEKKVHPKLQNAVIYSLEVSKLLSGANMKGQYEERVQNLLKEIKDIEDQGDIFPILFIDEIHTIMGAGGGSGSVDFSNAIKPALARGDLRTIGATTTDEWYKFIKNDPALDRRFISVYIAEPSFSDAVKIISKSLPYYEKEHNIKYNADVPARAVELSSQFIVDNSQPDKSFDLIDFAGSMASLLNKKEVTIDDVEIALSKQKNIDIDAIRSTRKNNAEHLFPKLQKEIFGQDTILEKIANRLELVQAGLNDPTKPYACFMFTGPSNVGKTLLTSEISKIMKARLFRLDMSEYTDSSSLNKLLGSPIGYIGSEDGSLLSKLINENPRCVLHLDNILSANNSILNMICQIMDNGYITDSKGKEINFKNVILILTQNTPQNTALPIGGDLKSKLTFNTALNFNSLSDDDLAKVTEKELEKINIYLIKKNIKIIFPKEIILKVSQMAKEKNLGTSGIKTAIEDSIMNQLKEKILFGDLMNIQALKEFTLFCENDKFLIK